jgi:hypothetical protein
MYGTGCWQERRDRVNDWQYEAGAAILIRPCRQHCSKLAISIDNHSCPVHPSGQSRVRDACLPNFRAKMTSSGANAEMRPLHRLSIVCSIIGEMAPMSGIIQERRRRFYCLLKQKDGAMSVNPSEPVYTGHPGSRGRSVLINLAQ